MFFYENQNCPVCGKTFTETDDIVSCPDCGAPHHRECWKEEGHCHYEDAHGTSEQWTKPEEKTKAEEIPNEAQPFQTMRCPRCGSINPINNTMCTQCGYMLRTQNPVGGNPEPFQTQDSNTPQPPFVEFAPFRNARVAFTGFSANERIEGETVEDLANVIGPNPQYYIPTFAKLSRENKKTKWNWASFLFTPYWLFFRKNYVYALLVFLFEFVQSVIIAVIEISKLGFLFNSNLSAGEIYETMNRLIANNSPLTKYFYLISLFSIVSLAIHFLFGFLGNYLYMHTCLDKIKKAREENPTEYKMQLRSIGGVSFTLACFSYLVLYFLPTIVQLIVFK